MIICPQAPSPDTYRGQFTKDSYPGDDLGVLYAEEVRALCKEAKQKGRTIAGFIAESLQSCGGQVIPPANYLKNVYKYGLVALEKIILNCRSSQNHPGGWRSVHRWRGSDRIWQSWKALVGFSAARWRHRTWHRYSRSVFFFLNWLGYLTWVRLGKPMGNGHPVAAVITTREIAQSFQNTGVEYFNTVRLIYKINSIVIFFASNLNFLLAFY